jgi:putative flippase GtrA
MTITALIPAYNPSEQLISLVLQLSNSSFSSVVIVNDGSSNSCRKIFDQLRTMDKVTVLPHAVNLGKGAALKTGLNHIYCYFPDSIGVVTIDADGQHLPEDACKISRALQDNPDALIMGVRRFDQEVPWRSSFGNVLTMKLFRYLVGRKLADTQSGLRGIPREFIPKLLQIESKGYEFELDMLLACKYSNRQIVEREINTVYLDGNKSSHFNPLLDSMKIYFVLFRFASASLLTALIDYTVFFLTLRVSSSLVLSQAAARLVAMLFNYAAVKRVVFYSDQKHKETFPKYAALILVSGSISLLLIKLFILYTPLNVGAAKVCSELLIFLANFAIQRDFIFTKHQRREAATDWDKYYDRPYKTATFSRKITENNLHRLIKNYIGSEQGHLALGELGGANSCFYDGIQKKIKPSQYHIFDNNQLGLDKLKGRIGTHSQTYLHNANVLGIKEDLNLDLVFSVGLIEHFSTKDTRKAIGAHFSILKPEGIAIISFPTPTFLYRISRCISELLGLWMFHDERPLTRGEVVNTIKDYGTILSEKIIWPIFFTQRIMVIRKDK